MSQVLVNESSLSGIGSAIRQKNGTSTTYKPAQMAAAIQALPGAPTLQSKTASANGTVTPDTGYDGLSQVTVNVPNSYSQSDEGKVVSGGALVAQTARSAAITQNGTYDTTNNNEVTVNVSGGGGGETILSGSSEPAASLGNNGAVYLQYFDGALLPSGYTALESVQFNGSQSIDTEILVTTQNLRVVSTIAITNIMTEALWGGLWSESGFFFMVYNGNFRWHSGGKSVDTAAISVNQWYKVETNKSKLIVDGVEYALANPTGTDASVNLKNGTVASSQGYNAFMKLKRTKIYSGTTLLADLIPAKDANNTACLYDAVRDTTFYSSGSAFLAGETATDGAILAVYLKVSGAWQNLIGSDINDVGGAS